MNQNSMHAVPLLPDGTVDFSSVMVDYKPTTLRMPVLKPADLQKVGYYTRPDDGAILLYLTEANLDRNIVLIEGPPGVGKTEMAKAIAKAAEMQLKAMNADIQRVAYLEYLVHSWTSNDDLFAAPHIGNITVGVTDPKDAYRRGVLWQAALESQVGPVVLILDEFEKCQQRSEFLVLTFLQDGRVQDSDPNGDGNVVYANLENIILVLTSNGTRRLHDATLRRALRYEMDYLPEDVEIKLIRNKTAAPIAAITAVVKAANRIRHVMGTSSPSLQEMETLVRVAAICPSPEYIAVIAKGTLCKTQSCMTTKEISELAVALFAAFGVKAAK